MNRPTLSLCLIARDEASLLPDCLASVRGVVDQIVVADTGSSDATPQIAAAAGAVVIHHPWQSDFADARNAALAAATGDWILVLDADERLGPGAAAAIREALEVGNFDLGFLPLHNAARIDASHASVVSGEARLEEPVLLPRLLRRTSDLRWEGVIHESVDHWFHRCRRRAIRVDAPIVHLGAIPELVEGRNKNQRNLSLLERACALQPDEPMRRAWLARELLRSGAPDRARSEAEAAWQSLLSRLAQGDRPAVVMPATLAAYLRLDQQDPDGVLEITDAAAPWAGGHPNLALLQAAALVLRGQKHELPKAIAALEQCLEADSSFFTHEVLPGATSWAAQTQLGLAKLVLGHAAEALSSFSEALAANPGHHHARYGAAEALLDLGRPQDALTVVEPTLRLETPDGWLLAAAAALDVQAFDDAAAFLERVVAPPVQPRRIALRERVRAALEGRQLLKQMTGNTPVTVKNPPQALLADGEACFERGDISGAVDRFVRALTRAPGSAEAWCNLGVGMHAAGLMNNAERALRMALRQEPSHREALISLGQVCVESGRPDQAAEALRTLLDHHPGEPVALEALQAMGLHSNTAEGATPLITVLLQSGASATLERCLDQLSLQDLHPTLYEVIVLSDTPQDTPRAYGLSWVAPGAVDAAINAARGRWLVMLESTDRPSQDLLRRHLAAQVTASQPCAVLGARGFEETRRTHEPLVAALDTLGPPSPVLSNISMPLADVDAISALRWHPEASPLPTVAHPEIRCWRQEALTLKGLLAAATEDGRAAATAWRREPVIPLPDLTGDPGREESWLGMRLLVEQQAPLIARLEAEVTAALDAEKPISPKSLGLLLQQSRRRGLIEGSIAVPVRAQRSLSSALTSIVIPNLNGMPHIVTAVESLRATTRGPVELIVVDNGSNDGSLEWLREQPDVKVLEMGENLGAPAARNRGLAIARGETILMCDNDVVFTPHWRPTLLGHLEAWPDVGMVGPMSDYVIGPQKFEGAPDRDGPVDLNQFAEAFRQQRAGQHTYTHRLILFFLIARKEVIDTIGGIDEGYGRWGFEDDDLCVRVRLAGYKMRVAQDCFIRHLGSQTAKSANLDYDSLLLQNWEVFKSKWRLDPDLPYGPYDPAAIMAQQFGPEHLFVPYRAANAPPPSDPIKLVSMR